MGREETGLENLPLNCWYINFTPFNYKGRNYCLVKEIFNIKWFIWKDLFLQIHNDFLELLLKNVLKCDPEKNYLL